MRTVFIIAVVTIDWEFGCYGLKIRNSRISYFFKFGKMRWKSVDFVTTVGLWWLTNENGEGVVMHEIAIIALTLVI